MIGAAEASKDRCCMAEQICASWSHSYVLSLFSADEGLAASQEGSRHLLVGARGWGRDIFCVNKE